jgi:alpha-L-rhamnosidase
MYGPVRSAWEIKDGDFIYEITIPANTTATVILPGAKAGEVKLNSIALSAELMQKTASTENGLKVELGSGEYRFTYPAAALRF